MTFRSLIKLVAQKENLPYAKAEAVLASFLDVSSKMLSSGQSVRLKKFGTIKPVTMKARNRFIPGTGVTKRYPAMKIAKLVLSTRVKELLNKQS